jgi:hypothetical protein
MASYYNNGGDANGSAPDSTVTRIQGIDVDSTTPTNGQVLQYNSSTDSWEVKIFSGSSGFQQSKVWAFQTKTATQYAGGFYEFFTGNNDFSPSITFGTVNASKAAHFAVITGAATVDELTIRVTGDSITDAGVESLGDTEDIVIPNATAANSYFETGKKWNGQVTIDSTIGGTPQPCNYGWTKYHDVGNQNFTVHGLEALWESDNTGSTSDIQLFHHKSTGWTYNAVSTPTPPTALAKMTTDHGGNSSIVNGEPGAWKRSNLSTSVAGSASEGILFCVISGGISPGNVSFRILTLELSFSIN